MSFNAELIKHLTALLELLRAQLREEAAPELLEEFDDAPPKQAMPKHRPGSQAWFKSLSPPRRDDGIDMNEMGRRAAHEISQRRLPRTPEQCRGPGRYR